MEERALEHHHEWETSPWPMVLSFGILFMLPLAFAFYFVYNMPMAAVLSLGIGVPLVVVSIAGWISEGVGQREEPGYGIGAMPFFIVAEAFIFVAFFAAYWATRLLSPQWPPPGTPEMPFVVPIIMTIVLVSSSFTIHMAEARLEGNDHGGFLTWLVLTIILGTAFLVLSANEWMELFHKGFTFKTNIYSTAFFSITGFHGSHVLVGLAIFICILLPALAGKVSHTLVKSAGVYWHFVDIIWFFVVSQVYFW